MTTLSEMVNELKKEGYREDFNILGKFIKSYGSFISIFPEEFVIDKYFRFEGISDPADEAILYAISSSKYKLKGLLVNGYGTSSDSLVDEIIDAIKEKISINNIGKITPILIA